MPYASLRHKIESLVTYRSRFTQAMVAPIYHGSNFLRRKSRPLTQLEFLIAHERRQIIVLNPKVGSRSILQSYGRGSFQLKRNLLKIGCAKDYSAHLIVRQPEQRFLSFWNDKVQGAQRFYLHLLRVKYSWYQEKMTMLEFLQGIQQIPHSEFEKHFMLQSEILGYLNERGIKTKIYNIACPHELAQFPLDLSTHDNSSKSPKNKLLSEPATALIQEIYRDDYRMMGL